MERFRKRRESDLEAELRSRRPVPRDELVRSIVADVEESRRTTRSGLRLAFAGALTAAMLVALAGFGGLGYAANSVRSATAVVQKVVKPKPKKTVSIASHTPAQSQYGKKCGHTPSTGTGPGTGTKPSPGVPPGNPNNNTCPGQSGKKNG